MGIAPEILELNLHGDLRLCVPAALDRITPYVLLEQEDWFEDEIRFVRRWLRAGMRAVDVGASYGVYAVTLARAVGAGGRVWAYEPTAASAALLARSLALNGCTNAEVVQAAVTESPGRIPFVTGEHSEINSIAGDGAPKGELREVPAVTLDAEARSRGWEAIDFLKIDIEGSEHAAVRGGAELLKRASPLVMFEIAHRGAFDPRAVDVLAELGYRMFRLLPGPLVLSPFDALGELDRFQLNLFACKEDRAQALARDGFLLTEASLPGTQPAGDAWQQFARSAAYARELAPQWPKAPGWLAAEDRKLYAKGLADFAQSLQAGAAASARVAHLSRALAWVGQALDARATPARRLSYARLAWMLGYRDVAGKVLAEPLGVEDARAEPFLAPSERYERTAGAEQPGWMRCAASEQHERLRDFSSFYSGARSLEVLEPIRDLPFRSPETDRRRNLVRLRQGTIKGPESSPLLAGASDENLNPQYWRR